MPQQANNLGLKIDYIVGTVALGEIDNRRKGLLATIE
jgi:hypothetical protein